MSDRASLATQIAEFLLVVAASALIFVVLLGFFKGAISSRALLGLYAFWALIYYLPTLIMLREVELTGLQRYVFCLTIVPLFSFLLLLTITFAFGSIPVLAGVFAITSGYGGSRGGMAVAIPLCLVSAGACWLWYRLLLALQRRAGPATPTTD